VASLAGCGAPAAEAAPPESPSPPAPGALPAPPGAGKSEPRTLATRRLNDRSSGHPLPLFADRRSVRLPGGWFSSVRLAAPRKEDLECPLLGAGSCARHAFFDDATGRWGPAAITPEGWRFFGVAGHRLLASDGDSIVSVAPGEEPRPWVTLPEGLGRLNGFAPVPTRPPALVLSTSNGLVLYPLIEQEGKRTTGKPGSLGISLVYGATARAARDAIAPIFDAHRKERAYWGALRAFAFEGTDRWGLVITEVNPPAFGAAEGRPSRKARHECGRSSSRHLSDVSVRKNLLLLVFRGTRKIAERLVWTRDRFDADRDPVQVSQERGQVTIDGQTFDAQANPVRRARDVTPPAPPPGAPLPAALLDDERVEALSFDEPAREGAVIFRDGESRAFAAIFGATPGEVRPPLALPPSFSRSSSVTIGRVWGQFVALPDELDEVVWLSGPQAGGRAGLPEDWRGPLLCDLVLAEDASGLQRHRLRPGGEALDLGTLARTKQVPSLTALLRSPEGARACLDGGAYLWIDQGARVLRVDTGEIVPASEGPRPPATRDLKPPRGCQAAATGPRSSVLACPVATSPDEASVRVEVRWLSE
jgi:hypothetical protein